ncbi:type II toxin-antitoxin system YafQ family toxin [Pediococcus ethanolidurans]|uniref:type II toxin-antitoxin system YafQ family toxin n=1 Tax=Pediococcus ethanolidurans TaxID=319653 RepID=UPI0021E83610|nr:type II toxin-antitoxin system YafQ family toxin [Pediococcus ethanolidurans]MCV3315782.1 type II toxin-antitoxin system YafQ family toxin [Pediococcus ethanolidurans]
MAAIIEQDTVILKRLKDHALKGSWHVHRKFHPARYGNYGNLYDNWVVIYCLNRNELVLLLVATGSHEVLNKN